MTTITYIIRTTIEGSQDALRSILEFELLAKFSVFHNQKQEIGIRKSELKIRNRKSEIGNQKSEIGIRNQKSKIGNRK